MQPDQPQRSIWEQFGHFGEPISLLLHQWGMTAIRWAMAVAVLSLLLLGTGIAYGFVSSAQHQDNRCGRPHSQPANMPLGSEPDPCARTEVDGRIVTWLFVVPGLAGLMGACVVGFAGSLGATGATLAGVGRHSPADAGSILD